MTVLKDLSIRLKLILLITGLTSAVVAGSLFLVTRTLGNQVETKLVDDFKKKQYFFQKQQQLVYDRLVESCLLIGQNAAFKANVALKDAATVSEAVNEFASFTKTDLLVVTDEEGVILSWLGLPGYTSKSLEDRPGVREALDGAIPDIDLKWPILWEENSSLYQVVSVPIEVAGSILGSITMGIAYTPFEAKALKGESTIDISIFLNDYLIGTSINDGETMSAESFQNFIGSHSDKFKRVIQDTTSSEVFNASLFNQNVYAYISPIGVGAKAYYLATAPQKVELAVLNKINKMILLVGLISLLLTGMLGSLFGNRITTPIIRLADGMQNVEAGDYSIQIEASGNDEIGQLTNSFNQMTRAVEERVKLKQYVGGHTMDMIQADADTISNAGNRKDIAVLFSDIRGFTKYSETRDPVEVINMLNTFLGYQADLVIKHHGSIDKYVGDEMLALFEGSQALQNAINCALEIQDHANTLHAQYLEDLHLGIGINYGNVIMGNIGSDSRKDYTVIGSEVNLAARLCSAAAGGEILFPHKFTPDLNVLKHTTSVKKMSFKGLSFPLEICTVDTNIKQIDNG